MFSVYAILLAECSNAAAATLSSGTGLSPVTRLALGTLKMEGTDQAISVSQATELLTLRQAYQSVSEVVQSMGSNVASGATDNSEGSSLNNSISNQGDLGGGPGGMPAGGDSIMCEINGGVIAQSTPATAQPSADTQTSPMEAMLINALIQQLETRSKATG